MPPSFTNPNEDWPFWRPRLADSALAVRGEQIQKMYETFLEMLRVRRSSPLFRLGSGAEVQSRVRFLNAEFGPMQQPGLLVMEIRDEEADGRDLDPEWKRLLVAVNVTNEDLVFSPTGGEIGRLERIFGRGEFRFSRESHLLLPPRSLSVWGERP